MGSQRGFTLTELLIGGALFVTISATAVALLGSAVPAVRTDGEVNRLVSVLQLARETAIARQRDVEVRINVGENSMLLVRHDEGVEVPVRQLSFEYGVAFQQFDGMGDTPEAYGNAGAVDFGGAVSMIFAPDGSFVAEDSVPLNGTLFLGVPGRPDTARAVTLTGTTARVRFYAWKPEGGTAAGWAAR